MARKKSNIEENLDVLRDEDGNEVAVPQGELHEAHSLEDYHFPKAVESPVVDLRKVSKPPTNGVTEGRMVHFVMANGDHRPAVIVNAWKESSYTHGEVNLTVFTDWMNDTGMIEQNNGLSWQTSVPFDNANFQPGTWHWIEPA